MTIDLTKPLTLLPNIRWEAADATTGYIWGKPKSLSNILSMLPAQLREQLEIPDDSIVAERWIASDDREFSSLVVQEDSPTNFADLLEQHGSDILGPRHWKEYGPYFGCVMKLLDTNPEQNKGSLSVQVHPKPGHPSRPSKPEMWQGEGSVYLGWNQDMTPDAIKTAIESSLLEQFMNMIELTPDKLVLVTGGLIHAIRYDSFLSEWSMAPGKEDIAKGNLKDATVAPYDRTDGKKPRPGKENFDGTIEVMTHANTFKKSEESDLLTSPKLVSKDGYGNKHHALFRTPVAFVDEYRVNTRISISLEERGLPLFVKQGQVAVWQHGQEVDVIFAGEERFLPHAMGEVFMKSEGDEETVLNTWYKPSSIESDEITGF